MVQQYQSPVRVYKHPFELVMAAYEKRFPTCKMIPIFAGSEITFEFRSDDCARHVVERRCKLLVDAPYLVKKIVGVEHVFFIQKNTLDRRARTLNIEAHNESFSSRVVIVETCKYYVHPDNSSWTCFEQTASLDVKSFFGFENAIEKVAIKQYSTNIKKGKEVIEYYITELLAQGVDYIRPFGEADGEIDVCGDSGADTEPSNGDVSSSRRGSRSQAVSLDLDSDSANPHERSFSDCVSNASLRSAVARSQSIASTTATSHTLTTDAASVSAQETTLLSRASSSSEMPAQWTSDSVVDVRPTSGTSVITAAGGCRVATASTSISGGSSASTLGDSCCPQASAAAQPDAADKLDDVYIQRYLGALTPVEESRLLQLRVAMRRTYGSRESLPSDAAMLRFLRARGCNVDKAREMLSRSLSYRKKHAVDSLLDCYESAEVLTKYFAGGWHYFDKHDQPLYLLRLGAIDVKGLLKSVGEERVLRHVLYACEQAVAKLRTATHVRGHPVSACTVVVDLDGLGMRHLWRPGIRALLRILEHLEANYPEMLHRVLVVRAPRIFPILWTLVSPFIDENTRQKFVVYSGREHVGPHGLEQFIDRQYLPVDLAGECEWCDVPDGGLVPKAAYRFEHDTWVCPDGASTVCTDSCSASAAQAPRKRESVLPAPGVDGEYRVVLLSQESAGSFEKSYPVEHAGGVLTWDFEVLSGDVQFELLCVDTACRPVALPQLCAERCSDDSAVSLSCGSSSSPSFSLSTNSSNGGCATSSSVVDCAFETAQMFKHGASVQGSHITTRAGQYVLRWSAVNSAAKLSYYTELLSRAQFHGSLSSLRSCRSSLCSLDVACTRIKSQSDANGACERAEEQHSVTFHF